MKKNLSRNAALVFGLALFMCFTSIAACNAAEECPLEIQIAPNSQYPRMLSFLKVFTIGEPVVITGIKVNRGSIEVKPWKPLPHTMEHGLPLMVGVITPASTVHQVDIQTDRGEWTFTVNK